MLLPEGVLHVTFPFESPGARPLRMAMSAWEQRSKRALPYLLMWPSSLALGSRLLLVE